MFVGLAGTAAESGFAVSIYEWHVGLCFIFFLYFYMSFLSFVCFC